MLKKTNNTHHTKDKNKANLDQNIKIIENLTNAVNKLSFSLDEHKIFTKKSKVFDSLSFLIALIFILMTIIWCQKG